LSRTAFDLRPLDQLVRTGRSFVKGLQYGLSRNDHLVNATLLDVGDPPVVMIARGAGPDATSTSSALSGPEASWVRRTSHGPMPPVPSLRGAAVSTT